MSGSKRQRRTGQLQGADRAALAYATAAAVFLGLYSLSMWPWLLTLSVFASLACYLRCTPER